jgi:hypothetical protein
VSGCGTRVVWYGGAGGWREGGAEHQEVVEGSLVHRVEPGLVAVHQVALGLGGEIVKGAGDAAPLRPGGMRGHGGLHVFGFDRPGAAEAPVGGGELLDQGELDAIDGGEAADVLLQDDLKILRRFVFEDHAFCEQAVTEGVLRRARFGLGSAGAGRLRAVRARGKNSTHRGHGYLVLW